MSTEQIIEADWTWTGEGFEPHVRVAVDADGWIVRVGGDAPEATMRLEGRALLPGFVNAHSHAFQRGLRGHGERFPEGAGSFWTWREAMYELVGRMDAETIYDLSLRSFSEMLAAGMTTVGEFHYLHHDHTGRGYAFDETVLRAARDAGIRIVLLGAYYRTGGINQPLSDAQRRFHSGSIAEYLQQLDRLTEKIDARTQSLGVVAHSIRAATIDEVAELYAEARRRNLVFHMHVEEQRKEIEDCRAAYGKAPMEMVTEHLEIDGGFTAVHCTHTEPVQMRRFLSAGGAVCMCPITEANLGDGIADLPEILAAGGSVCVGTDLNSRLCMTEELRWLEYVQRLRHETRGVCADMTGRTDAAMLRTATINGADSLGLPTGRIAPGCLADFVAIDLNAPALAGWTSDSLLAAFIFGCGPEVVASTCVGGEWKHHRNLG